MDFTGIKPYSPENVSTPDTYYSLGEDCIVVRKYIPSHLESGHIKLSQDRLPTGEIVFLFENYFDGNLALLSDNEDKAPDIAVHIDHEEYEPAFNHGYLLVGGPFDTGSKVMLSKAPIEEEVYESISSAEEASIANDAFPANEAPITEEAYIAEEAPIDEEASIAEEAPIADDAFPANDIPIMEEASMAEEAPITEKTPINEEVYIPEEASFTEEISDSAPIVEDVFIAPLYEDSERSPSDQDSNETEAITDDDLSKDDLSEDENISEDDLSEDYISEEDLSEEDIAENDFSEDVMSEDEDIPDDDLFEDEDIPEDDLSEEDDISEDDLFEEDGSEDDLPEDEDIVEDKLTENEDSRSYTVPLYSHTYENASILYSESKERYVLKIAEGSGAHAILPGGVEVFARSDGHAFKGYRMRIGEKEYDLVVMNVSELSEKAHRCNAYMKTLGSFSGDCCYCIDITHPEKNGTHGVRKGTAYIDSETGYKWGMTTPGCYEFELENGNYNVYTITKDPDGHLFSDQKVRKVSNGYLTLYSNNDIFTHISITAADAVISENSSYEWLTPDEKVLEAAYLYIPDDLSDALSGEASNTSSSNETTNDTSSNTVLNTNIGKFDTDAPLANDTGVASQPEKPYKEPQFEHIQTGRSQTGSDKPTVSPYVFGVLEPIEDQTVKSDSQVMGDGQTTKSDSKVMADDQTTKSDSQVMADDQTTKSDSQVMADDQTTKSGSQVPEDTPIDFHEVAEIRATHTAEHTTGEVAAIFATHTDETADAINEITDENSKAANSADQIDSQNSVPSNIRISTYTVSVPAANKKSSEHLTNTLKAKKAKNAATAAGIAAGAALLGGIIKALTSRKK
ncbi:MAG: hypothetical protein K6E85_15355 [Lachnospiraceae bacterium]|nr:hypothetical protein [Lachnospiraceae bacterium]